MHNIVKLCVAGGGKTTKIKEYIEELKKKNIDIRRILLISFSNTTVQDLETKLQIKAYTLHSFCIGFDTINSSIIDNYYYLIDYIKQKYIKLRYINTTTLNNWIFNYELCNAYEKLDNLPIDIELNTQFRDMMKEVYNNIYNQRSFIQILQHFLYNIDNILPLIYTKFDYLIIDEAQDLSNIQLKIIYQMIQHVFSHENKGFIIVGDPQQIIYGFQGASTIMYNEFIRNIQALCKLRGLNMQIEHHNTTYRFGGEILSHINTIFPQHTSGINNGKYTSIKMNNINNICEIINNNIDKYGIENVFILFKRNSELIEKIQNQLNNGINLKIYLYKHFLHTELQLIYNYLSTYGSARKFIINSIFKHNNIYEFHNKLKQYSHNNFALFEYLNSIIVLNTELNRAIWIEIYNLSLQYISFIEFFLNLPLFITITKKGIQFMTIHASKGLESKCVIFINEPHIYSSLIMHNGLIFKNNKLNKFIIDLYNKYIHEQDAQNKNMYYVAMTRAQEQIVEILI